MNERERKTIWQREDYARNPEKYKEAARSYRDKNRRPKKQYIPKTHCNHGHEMTEDNTYIYIAKTGTKEGSSVRQCKVCIKSKSERRAIQIRGNHLFRKFGITLADYDSMLTTQGGMCAGCKTTQPGGMGSFHVDHCHITGGIRKLLCMKCNTVLGYVDDNPELLETLADYVRQHQDGPMDDPNLSYIYYDFGMPQGSPS